MNMKMANRDCREKKHRKCSGFLKLNNYTPTKMWQ